MTVTPELRRSVKSNLNDYLASVQLPDQVAWHGFQGDRHSAAVVFTFHDAATINKREAAEAMKALDARISAERARESRLNRLRSSIGRKYCSNGELSYVTRICSRNVGCIDRDVTEPGQLHAYLEGVSEDGLRIQLRVHNWATDAGRLRAGAVSDITFSSRQSLGNPSYGFSLGPAFTQRAQPGLVFWSDAASWSQCSR